MTLALPLGMFRAETAREIIKDGRKASELTGHLTERIRAKVYDGKAVRKARAVR
ncbi:hypothetical protein GALL_84030 [mine drainage metagenome]|uniref:Uncharacterized protein n=1 Tax=mine drainage metagenome TaxID=410659 RepID=A0A1J5SM71_9ZZZZ